MKEELEFFQAWWKILKKYWNPPAKDNESKEAEKFWKSLISDCRNLRKRYDHNKLFEPWHCDITANFMFLFIFL